MINQQNRLSTASAPIQRAAGESTWTTTRSRARNRGAKLTRDSLTAKGYARYLFAPGKYLTMPSCTTVANDLTRTGRRNAPSPDRASPQPPATIVEYSTHSSKRTGR